MTRYEAYLRWSEECDAAEKLYRAGEITATELVNREADAYERMMIQV